MFNIGLESGAQCLLNTQYTGIRSNLAKDAYLASALLSFDRYIKLYTKNVVTMHWQEMVLGEDWSYVSKDWTLV